jgi:hypothetical protein
MPVELRHLLIQNAGFYGTTNMQFTVWMKMASISGGMAIKSSG